MNPERVRRDVIDLLAKGMLSVQRDAEKQAAGWALLVTDEDDGGSPTIHGPFDTELEASTWGDQFLRDVNKGGTPGDGWVGKVLPIQKTLQ